jgi:hypothetical protein
MISRSMSMGLSSKRQGGQRWVSLSVIVAATIYFLLGSSSSIAETLRRQKAGPVSRASDWL